jgi:hypothetical protein
MEASLENEHAHRAAEFKGIAAILKARLIALGMAGEAQKDLIAAVDDPKARVVL